jgi:hypothetical protein
MGDKIGGALSGAFGALGQFGAVAGELTRSVGESLEGLGKSTSGMGLAITALGGLAAAGLAAAGAYVELGKAGAELVEHFSQVSQKTGIGIHDLQVFAAAGSTVGVSMDDMVIGMRKFGQALTGFGKGAAAQSVLRELGVTSKDSKEALLETADAFAKMEDGPRKASDAVALFGKSGLQLIPLLNKGRDGIQQWAAAVDKLGPVIGKDAVEANEKYKDSVTELSLAWDKVKVQAEQSTIPTLSKLTSWVANNFQSIKAGFAGGFAAGSILKDQQAAQGALTASVKDESAAKDALLKKQEELQASLQNTFELQKAGGSAALALERARQQLGDDVQAGLFKEASAIQLQLPLLEKAAQLEAQRAAEVKRSEASYLSVLESIKNIGSVKPALKAPPLEHKEIESLFGPQTKDPLEGAPNLGQPSFLSQAGQIPELGKTLNLGKSYLDTFYSQWNSQSKGTTESINADYDAQLAKLQGYLALGEVSEQQAKDVYLKIQQERFDGLKQLREKNGTSTFKDAWTDMFSQLQASGKDFARSITQDIGSAIESLNGQLAQFAVTGKGLNLKSIGQSLETNLFSSVLKKGESSLFGSLGGMLGLGDGTKPDGSTSQNALWVQFAGAAGAGGIGGLPLPGIGNLLNPSGGDTSSSGGGLLGMFGGGSSNSGSGGGIGSFFSSFGDLFGGFMAGGGSVDAGKAYIVGEKRPELFMPRSSGQIVPSLTSGNGGSVQHIQQTVNISTPDADSFKKSQSQIASQMSSGLQRGASRLGR